MNPKCGTDADLEPREDTEDGTRGRHIVKFFLAAFLLTMMMLVSLAWHAGHAYQQFHSDQTRNFRTLELTGVITHLDEVLTMSARMAAATGEPGWEQRYRVFEPQLDAAIQEAMALWPDVFISEAVSQTNLANIKLVAMEYKAFDAVRRGDLDAATDLLYSDEYEKQKQVYSSGMVQVAESMRQRVQKDVDREKRIAAATMVLIAVLLILTPVIWVFALHTLGSYIAHQAATSG